MLPRQCGFLRGAPTPYARAELSREEEFAFQATGFLRVPSVLSERVHRCRLTMTSVWPFNLCDLLPDLVVSAYQHVSRSPCLISLGSHYRKMSSEWKSRQPRGFRHLAHHSHGHALPLPRAHEQVATTHSVLPPVGFERHRFERRRAGHAAKI